MGGILYPNYLFLRKSARKAVKPNRASSRPIFRFQPAALYDMIHNHEYNRGDRRSGVPNIQTYGS